LKVSTINIASVFNLSNYFNVKSLAKHIDTLFAGIPMRELVDKKGIIVRFVIGRRYNFGGSNSILQMIGF